MKEEPQANYPSESATASAPAERDQQSKSAAAGSDHVKPDYIVGIGASAGGLSALRRFFSQIPKDSNLAYVVVVHLAPDHESHLAELLQPGVSIPVCQVQETMAIEKNRVYVIPPNANLDSIDTHLRLSQLEKSRRERAPIDHFFRTLARTHDGDSIGVILTGTGSDGTLGIREIKGSGGLIIVQDPQEAEFDGMPQSAIATGLADFILQIREMPATLLAYSAVRPEVTVVVDAEETDGKSDAHHLQEIFSELRLVTKRDFSTYKAPTISRRIQRRMQIHQMDDLGSYAELVTSRPDEARALADDFMITVTSFFRDPEVFQKLEHEIIPQLFVDKGPDDRIRLWSVGCATGEEAYSLAILLLEQACGHGSPPRLQVFASDLHEKSLRQAREGFFPGDIDTDVPADKLQRYFIKENGGYRIRKEVREIVTFAPHNLLADPPFSHVDLVSCRNLLIYINRETQRDTIKLFHYALRDGGYLTLGTSESVEGSELFTTVDKKNCIFRKRNVPVQGIHLPFRPLPGRSFAALSELPVRASTSLQYSHLHLLTLELYAPPSALVGADDQVLHFSATAGQYLVQPGGDPTSNILSLVQSELRADLRAAMQIVREHGSIVKTEKMHLKRNGRKVPIALEVRPVIGTEYQGFVLVLFIEGTAAENSESAAQPSEQAGSPTETSDTVESRHEMEINQMRRQLQSSIREYELGQEAMRAAYEEMQSTNEELRSTMEELETSKEELQSMNEELQTVNQENRHKVEEFAQLSDDLQNLLFATDIATLFLDRELRIMRFTPRTAEIFNLRVTDRGRPLLDITHRLSSIDLKSDAELVLKSLVPVEHEVSDEHGKWYLTRVLPYRSAEDRIDGVVITFVDITRRKLGEETLRLNDQRKNEFLATLAHELRNPLSSISAGIDILKLAGDKIVPYQSLVGTMGAQATQLVALVNDLLDISRISQGKFDLKKRKLVLQDVIGNALEAARVLFEDGKHKLTVDMPSDKVELEADPNRLIQVLVNLLSNSTKFTPREGHIHVSARRTGNRVRVSVKDNGRGIKKEQVEKVFEMFEQGGDYRDNANSGLGIGLSLAKTLIEMHGGNISIDSAGPGTGCEVSFQLPVLEKWEAAAPLPDTQADAPHDKRTRFRILLVDDNLAIRETMATLLDLLGHEVTTAANGREALAAVPKLKPHIIFMDLGMPEMDGYEAATRIREIAGNRSVTLVALSGWGTSEDKRHSREAGFDHHFVKPLNLDEMTRFLDHVARDESRAQGRQ